MPAAHFSIGKKEIDLLDRHPRERISSRAGGIPFEAWIGIPNYGKRIADHYRELLPNGLHGACEQYRLPDVHFHFGLICEFARPIELELHDDDMNIFEPARTVVDRFGPVVIKNAYLGPASRKRGQKNVFPHLNFHKDRDLSHPNIYSLFTRNPFDPLQRPPRTTSTLVVADIVAYLQSVREGKPPKLIDGEPPNTYKDVFIGENMRPLLGDIAFEVTWNEPEGTGEIAMLDNRNVVHASFHKDMGGKGYHIGARYLKVAG